MSHNPHQLAALIKQQARALGFDLVGIASADPSAYRDYFRHWLDTDQAGTMAWMHKRFDERTDVRTYFPGCQSVVCVAMSYYAELPIEAPIDNRQSEIGSAKIARYAWGDDYHEVIKDKLDALAAFIQQLAPEAKTVRTVDTSPVLEKELAARAGVGWMGKNTCIIHPGVGSFFFLGEVLTTLALPPDEPAIDRCGSCRRCIDACPTAAITGPYQLDARRCISYLTIEHRSDILPELQGKIGHWLYGCDICQDVCPYNRDPLPTSELAFASRFPAGVLDASAVLTWTPEQYQQTLRRSAMKRVKLPVLQRNARTVLSNGDQ